MAPAKTGRDNKSKIAVTKTPQPKRGILYMAIPVAFMFRIVEIKFIAPNREDIPARWSENIAMSTAGVEWAIIPLKGG